MADFILVGNERDGTYALAPQTPAGADWARTNLAPTAETLGSSYLVDAAGLGDLLARIEAGGLVVDRPGSAAE